MSEISDHRMEILVITACNAQGNIKTTPYSSKLTVYRIQL